jgi:hypothetical protein
MYLNVHIHSGMCSGSYFSGSGSYFSGSGSYFLVKHVHSA